MFIAYTVLAVIMSFLLVGSATAKLRRDPRVVHSINEVIGVPLRWLPGLAALEFAGAAGLLIGIFWWPLGVAAAIGVILYFIGASVGHLRVKDFNGLPVVVVIALVAVAVLVVRSLSVA